jgi:hypothetical protein
MNGNPLDFMAFLTAERRKLGLAGFLCRTCCAAYRRARRRGGAGAGAAYWYAEAYRWCRADYDARRRDGGCRGR